MNKNEKFVITINREVGSGGRTVGRKLAETLGVKYCDKAVIDGLTKKFGLTPERIEEIKAQKKSWWNDINNYYQTLVNSTSQPMEAEVKLDNATMFETEKRIQQELAEQTSCVIAGRTGFMVFREWPNHLSVFIQASMDYRIKRIMDRQNVSMDEARSIITKIDATREAYIKKYEDTSRYDTRNYQLVISMDGLTEDDAAQIILDYINRTSK
ncbi:MAG: cytidylate kinase-like family protein [Prevotella sp.]|jgi:cytidylate kinase|nr:cytidylate kinase-like family protein [Prevotella sp.]